MNYFLNNINEFLYDLSFAPLLLIGLLITSLSLILTLKDTNIYNAKYKKQNNIIYFINRIYRTAGALIILYLLSFTSRLFDCEILNQSTSYCIIYFIVYLFVCLLVLIIAYNLLLIAYTIKNIVITSLK